MFYCDIITYAEHGIFKAAMSFFTGSDILFCIFIKFSWNNDWFIFDILLKNVFDFDEVVCFVVFVLFMTMSTLFMRFTTAC
jgi:hypothetical protein